MRASRRNLAIIVGILAALALAGGIAVRLGLGETDERLPDFGDAGAGGAPAPAAAPGTPGARPLLDDGGVPAGMSRIAGTVRDLARDPVAGVEVRFTGPAGEASATSDGAGRYRIDLHAGGYQLRAVAEHAVSFQARHIAVPAGLDADGVDLSVVRTAYVAGRVVDGNGAPVAGADIGSHTEVMFETLEDDEIAPLGTGRADGRGAFRIAVPAGQVTVTARDGARSGETAVRWVEPAAEVAGVEVVIDTRSPDAGVAVAPGIEIRDAGPGGGATIAGVVRGPAGPLAVFDVELRVLGVLRFVTTDGRYRIDNLIPGRSELTVSAPGLAPLRIALDLKQGQVADGSVTLAAGGTLEGTVTDRKTGRPLAGVRTSLITGGDSALGYSDARGRYQLRDVTAGRRSLEARRPGHVGQVVQVAVTAGITLRQNLTLEPLAADAPGDEIEFAGIGASLQVTLNECRVVGTVPGSPAELAALRAGDVIERIDGRDIAGWAFPEVVEAIRGVAGTVVHLDLRRGDERFARDIIRATIRFRE